MKSYVFLSPPYSSAHRGESFLQPLWEVSLPSPSTSSKGLCHQDETQPQTGVATLKEFCLGTVLHSSQQWLK